MTSSTTSLMATAESLARGGSFYSVSVNSRRRVITSLLAGLSASAVVLAGCSSDVEGDIEAGMGNATPVPAASPATPDTTLGKTKKIDENITDAILVGDQVILKAGDKIFAGPLNNPAANVTKLDADCGELAPSDESALLPCSDGIHVITEEGSQAAVVGRGTAYSAAVGLDGGRIIGARADNNVIEVFGADGEPASDFKAANHGSQLLVIPEDKAAAKDDEEDNGVKLLEVNRPETSVHELKLDESRAGSALRAGIGVGKAAAGDNVIAAADTKGNQLLIYTATDVIRLHQAAPVPEAPWAVAVDDSRGIVWVTSTKVNKLTGYDITSGTPVKVADIDTIADPQSVVATKDGQVAVFSATGAGAQIFDAADVDKAIAKNKQKADEYRDEMAVREPADKLPTGADSSEGETK